MRRGLYWVLLPASFLAFFYFFPLVRIIGASFLPGRNFSAPSSPMPDLTFLSQVLGFTLGQASLSTLITLALGVPIAWWLKHSDAFGRRGIQILLTLPFVMPTVVVGTAFTALLGPSGVVNGMLMQYLELTEPPIKLLHTFPLIILAHTFYNTGVVVRIVAGFWSQLDSRFHMAAQSLGASPIRSLFTIDLPLILPSIISASLLVFLFCFSSFGVILILGGLRFATIEVEIYRQAISFFNLPTAALLSLLQLGVTFTAMFLYTRIQNATSRTMAVVTGKESNPGSHKSVLFWSALPVYIVTGLLVTPLLALLIQSLTLGDDNWTLRYYRDLLAPSSDSAFLASALDAIGNSIRYGMLTMLLSLFLGICMAYAVFHAPRLLSRWLDPIFLLPLGTSAVTLGLGFILAMGPLRTSSWLVPIAHSLIAVPFVFRVFLPSVRRIQASLREASMVLGATPRRTWWHIDLPLLMPALMVAGVFAFTTSLGEFGASLLVARPQYPTMPLIIYRALGQPGLLNLGKALAMSTILMLTAGAAMLILDRIPWTIREF